jgi:hypothetical protein
MENIRFSKLSRGLLWAVSGIGLFGINGLFLYTILFRPEVVTEAMGNLYALVFMIEAFILLPLLCFLVAVTKFRSPNWFGFLVLSLLGSLAFSIPFSILLWTRQKDKTI